MSYDPHREDYQRLGLRFARSLDGKDPAAATRAFASFGRRFSQNRDSLPQSDADRAFHLVAEATTLIDYELPFANDAQAEELIERGHRLLDEALALDSHCHDALRMKQAAESTSFESYYDFLASSADDVRAACEEARAQAHDESPERALLEADIAMRPYPQDSSDVRFTCALAYAKLEDEQGLDLFAAKTRPLVRAGTDDAWMQLSRISLAHKRHDMREAQRLLSHLISTYPHAAAALAAQKELPDGVFSRLAVAPFSEDELILAISEGTVLLQEGRDDSGRGVLGTWVARQTGLDGTVGTRS